MRLLLLLLLAAAPVCPTARPSRLHFSRSQLLLLRSSRLHGGSSLLPPLLLLASPSLLRLQWQRAFPGHSLGPGHVMAARGVHFKSGKTRRDHPSYSKRGEARGAREQRRLQRRWRERRTARVEAAQADTHWLPLSHMRSEAHELHEQHEKSGERTPPRMSCSPLLLPLVGLCRCFCSSGSVQPPAAQLHSACCLRTKRGCIDSVAREFERRRDRIPELTY